jgi:hypothetical protein
VLLRGSCESWRRLERGVGSLSLRNPLTLPWERMFLLDLAGYGASGRESETGTGACAVPALAGRFASVDAPGGDPHRVPALGRPRRSTGAVIRARRRVLTRLPSSPRRLRLPYAPDDQDWGITRSNPRRVDERAAFFCDTHGNLATWVRDAVVDLVLQFADEALELGIAFDGAPFVRFIDIAALTAPARSVTTGNRFPERQRTRGRCNAGFRR